jgi:putative glutamine amidotransferase
LLQPNDDFERQPPQGILLPGGGDLSERYYDHPLTAKERGTLGEIEPEREKYELQLLSWAVQNDLPTLGICRGCQMINAFAGGTLIPDIPVWHSEKEMNIRLNHRSTGDPAAPAHDINLMTQGRLCELLGGALRIGVNSSHHQAIGGLGRGLTATARAEDEIIEAVEDLHRTFWMGVQFHPERMWKHSPVFSHLFQRFIDLAENKRPS